MRFGSAFIFALLYFLYLINDTELMLKIYTKGELIDSSSRFECASALKALFKLPDAKIEHLLSGQTVVVKKVISDDEANRYMKAFTKAGLQVYLEHSTIAIDETAQYAASLDISKAKRLALNTAASIPDWGVSAPNSGSFLENRLDSTTPKVPTFDFEGFEVLSSGEMTETEKQRLANQVSVDIPTDLSLSEPE